VITLVGLGDVILPRCCLWVGLGDVILPLVVAFGVGLAGSSCWEYQRVLIGDSIMRENTSIYCRLTWEIHKTMCKLLLSTWLLVA
jgi:hypothetical protein